MQTAPQTPPNPMDQHLHQIADRIHGWRDEAGYTLQELADRSGVAASTVHKIEKNQTVPTISVLLKICTALERRPDELLVRDEAEVHASVRRKADNPRVGKQERSMIEQMAPAIANATLDIWRVTHAPAEGSGKPDQNLSYKGELIVICEVGQLTFAIDEIEYTIEAGDSLHFNTKVPHRWFNSGSTDTVAIFYGTIPKNIDVGLEGQREQLARDARARGVVMYDDETAAPPASDVRQRTPAL